MPAENESIRANGPAVPFTICWRLTAGPLALWNFCGINPALQAGLEKLPGLCP